MLRSIPQVWIHGNQWKYIHIGKCRVKNKYDIDLCSEKLFCNRHGLMVAKDTLSVIYGAFVYEPVFEESFINYANAPLAVFFPSSLNSRMELVTTPIFGAESLP